MNSQTWYNKTSCPLRNLILPVIHVICGAVLSSSLEIIHIHVPQFSVPPTQNYKRRGEKVQDEVFPPDFTCFLIFFVQKLKRNRWGCKTGKTTSGPTLLWSVHFMWANYFHKHEGSTSKAGEEVLHSLHSHQPHRISHAVGTCLEVLAS